MKPVLLILTLILMTNFSCKTGPNNAGKAKNTYTIKVGEVQVLTFKTGPSTGYSWQCMNEKNDYVELIKKESTPTSKLIGAPAIQNWSFKGIKTGTVTLNFVYKRPWLTVNADSINYTIKVK